jgi:hypothetical protein
MDIYIVVILFKKRKTTNIYSEIRAYNKPIWGGKNSGKTNHFI